tara:strand:- start:3576 stop:4136 length:561 start_codon:yes stop_codon:yes gene_type:complete
MSEETKVNTQQAEENRETNPTTQGAEKKENPLHENPRFKEVISQRNQAREELSKYQAEEKAKEERLLEKQGEYKTILAKRDSVIENLTKENEIYKQKEKAESERLEALIPDDHKVFTKSMDNTTKAKYIEQLNSNINANKADSSRAGANAAAKGEFGGYDSWEELAANDLALAEKLLEKDTKGFIR